MTEVVTYREALAESMQNALERNDNSIIFGQGVDDFKGTFGTTLGLAEKFGAQRVQDVPIIEEGITGICMGAAMNGLRPIHVHIRADFLFLALNQVLNMAAKYKYMFAGHHEVPIFIRAVVGRSWGQGAQHSQSPQSLLSHFPGLKVIMPSSSQSILESYDYLLNDYNSPVVSLEHRLMYDLNFDVDRAALRKGEQSLQSYVARQGSDITIVATSIMVLEALRAAKHLEAFGIQCEVIDLHCTSDITEEVVLASVEKTGRLLVADTSWLKFGTCAEVARLVCENIPHRLKAPMKSVGMVPTPCPTAKALEDLYYPNLQTLVSDILEVLGESSSSIQLPDEKSMADVYKKFRGPF